MDRQGALEALAVLYGEDELEDFNSRGPLCGETVPVHGGNPNRDSCDGCIDCCHLPEISLTNEEAGRLWDIHTRFETPLDELAIWPDPAHVVWQIVPGPCVFRRYDRSLVAGGRSTAPRGGCRIYAARPAGGAIFTCRLRTELSRSL